MKKTFSFLLALVMIIGLFPMSSVVSAATEYKRVNVSVDQLVGNSYIICDEDGDKEKNKDGNVLKSAGGIQTNVTVYGASTPYISSSNVSSTHAFTIESSGSGYKFRNSSGKYLKVAEDGQVPTVDSTGTVFQIKRKDSDPQYYIYYYGSGDSGKPYLCLRVHDNSYQFEKADKSDGGDKFSFYSCGTAAPTTYTVTWKNYDGTSTYAMSSVASGSKPTYSGSTPTRASDGSYTYTFAGWSTSKNATSGISVSNLPAVTGDITYYAAFSQTAVSTTYKVTWKSYDDSYAYYSEWVERGTTPAFDQNKYEKKTMPEKGAGYTFIGWSTNINADTAMTLSPVTSNVTYYAAFSQTSVSADTVYMLTSDITSGEYIIVDRNTNGSGTALSGTGTAGTAATVTVNAANGTYTKPYITQSDKSNVFTLSGSASGFTLKNNSNQYMVVAASSGSKTPTWNTSTGSSFVYNSSNQIKANNYNYLRFNSGSWSFHQKSSNATSVYFYKKQDTPTSYTVTWKNYDGSSTLETDSNVTKGTKPSYDGATPTKASNAQYTYTFSGWAPSANQTSGTPAANLPTVTGNVTYYAAFTPNLRAYTVTWVDGNGNIIKTENVDYGVTPSYSGATPTKNSTSEHTYTFNNSWLPAVSPVTGDVTYTAQFDAVPIVHEYSLSMSDSFTVVAADTVTVTEGNYKENSLYDFRDDDQGVWFTPEFQFSIDGVVQTVATNTTYRMKIISNDESILESWDNDFILWFRQGQSGTTTAKVQIYNSTTNEIVAEKTITVTYNGIFTITWLDDDGTVIDTTSVAYGETPTHANPQKSATARYTYTFNGWTPEITSVTGDATYTATYNQVLNKYTIKFVNYDGTELQSGEVAYGETPSYDGATPTKSADAQYTYTFGGWSPEITSVTGDATYTATYNQVLNKYTIKFVN